MSDHFDALGLPCSLTIDPSEVEASWRTKTRENETGELHEARAILSDPVSRLEHWLVVRGVEIGRGAVVDPAVMDLFSRIGPATARADEITARSRGASSAIAKALVAKEAIAAQKDIQECLGLVQAEMTKRESRFPEFQSTAESGASLEDAIDALGQLKFLRKWRLQCQERLLALLDS